MSRRGEEQRVTSGRFEIEENGATAYLEYREGAGVLELIHTEVAEGLRHRGLAAELAETALGYARAKKLKVDVICPVVRGHIEKHPEWGELVMR